MNKNKKNIKPTIGNNTEITTTVERNPEVEIVVEKCYKYLRSLNRFQDSIIDAVAIPINKLFESKEKCTEFIQKYPNILVYVEYENYVSFGDYFPYTTEFDHILNVFIFASIDTSAGFSFLLAKRMTVPESILNKKLDSLSAQLQQRFLDGDSQK